PRRSNSASLDPQALPGHELPSRLCLDSLAIAEQSCSTVREACLPERFSAEQLVDIDLSGRGRPDSGKEGKQLLGSLAVADFNHPRVRTMLNSCCTSCRRSLHLDKSGPFSKFPVDT